MTADPIRTTKLRIRKIPSSFRIPISSPTVAVKKSRKFLHHRLEKLV
jgi:hypothetical protein